MGEMSCRLILVRLERTRRKKETEVCLVFAISSADAVVCADYFGIIIGSDVGKEIQRHRGTRPKRLRREERSIAISVYTALSTSSHCIYTHTILHR